MTAAAKPDSPSGDARCETCGQNYYSESSGASDYHRHKELEGKHRCGVGEAGGVWLPNHTCEELRTLEARVKELELGVRLGQEMDAEQVALAERLKARVKEATARAEKAEADLKALQRSLREEGWEAWERSERERRAALQVKP